MNWPSMNWQPMNWLTGKSKWLLFLLLDGLLHLALLLYFAEDTETIVLCILLEVAFFYGLHTGKKRPPATDTPTAAPSTHPERE